MRTNAYDCWPAGEGIPQPVGIRIEGKFPLTVKVEVIPFGFLRSPAIEAWNDSSVSEHDVCLADSAHMRAGGFRCGVTFQDRGTGRGDHPSRLRRVGPGRKGNQRDSADRAGDEATPRHARCGNRADFFRVHSSSITKRIARRYGSDHRSRRCQTTDNQDEALVSPSRVGRGGCCRSGRHPGLLRPGTEGRAGARPRPPPPTGHWLHAGSSILITLKELQSEVQICFRRHAATSDGGWQTAPSLTWAPIAPLLSDGTRAEIRLTNAGFARRHASSWAAPRPTPDIEVPVADQGMPLDGRAAHEPP
jgi:hypothetical protein